MTRHMKKIILLLMLLTNYIMFSQYKFTYSQSGFVNDNCSINSNLVLEIGVKEENTFTTLESAKCGRANPSNNTTYLQQKPNSIRFRDGNFISDEYLISYRNNSNCKSIQEITLRTNSDEVVTISFDLVPNYSLTAITPTSQLVSACNKIIISSPDTYNLEFYNWQYNINSNGWINLSDFYGKNTLEIGLSEIPNLAIGQTVHFRISNCTNSNILSYSFTNCSPKIQELRKSDITCSYRNDGTMSILFERKLESYEKLNINLLKLFTGGYSIIKDKNDQTYDSTTLLYNWPENLDAGTYKIKYQITPIGDPVESDSFTINPATPLTFELQNPKNPSCFGAEDGSVEVLITSGIPKFFEVNGDSVIPDELGPNLYRIKNLKAKPDGHKIKVTDANNCIDNGKYE